VVAGPVSCATDKSTRLHKAKGRNLVNAYAPIAIFAYNRPEHLKATLQSLAQCPQWSMSRVILYCDGPRTQRDEAAVLGVRAIARSLDHRHIEIVERDSNLGLGKSVMQGVTDLCERFGRVIVVEDDLLVSGSFLSYLNRALDVYEQRRDVYQVSAHMFDVPEFAKRNSALLLPMITTWGWATWARAWREFDVNVRGSERLSSDGPYRRRFNLGNHYDYFNMLLRQKAGKGDWGVCWYWTVFAADGLSCFPPRSLVLNTGMDGSGTNGRGILRRFRGSSLDSSTLEIDIPPDAALCSEDEFSAVKRAIWRQNGGWRGWAVDRAKAMGVRLQTKLAVIGT
jgi:Glycosyltransferase like family 2